MNKLFFLFVLTIFVVCLMAISVESRGIWGKRRRDLEDKEATQNGDAFDSSDRSSNIAIKNTGSAAMKSRRNVSPVSKDSVTNIANLVDAYLQMMDELVVSPQFDKIATPEGIKDMLDQIPGLGNSPEILSMMESPEFQNPAVLKATIKEGLKTMRAYAGQFIEMLDDPMKIQELLSQLPLDIRKAIEGVLSGDVTALKSMISTLPGVGASQKEALASLLDGNTGEMVESVRDILADDNQVEAARLQFLENPSMAEAFGIPIETLHDKDAWAKLMKDGMDALDSMTDEEALQAETLARTKFAGTRAI